MGYPDGRKQEREGEGGPGPDSAGQGPSRLRHVRQREQAVFMHTLLHRPGRNHEKINGTAISRHSPVLASIAATDLALPLKLRHKRRHRSCFIPGLSLIAVTRVGPRPKSCITHHSLSPQQDKNVVISLTDRHFSGLTSVRPTQCWHILLCALHCNIVRFPMFCKLHCTNSRMRFDTRTVHCAVHCALCPTH